MGVQVRYPMLLGRAETVDLFAMMLLGRYISSCSSTDSFCQVSQNSQNDIMLPKIIGLILEGVISMQVIFTFLTLTYFMQGYKINTPPTLFNLFIK